MTKNANKPPSQMIDTATISIKAGNGGDGRVSFRREKFIPRGGPDGGDGGHGGSVYLVADNNMETLLDFRSKPVFAAQPGEAGQKKNMTGSNGVDLFIKLPVGTLVFEDRVSNSKEKVLVADMNEAGKTFLIAKGGVGGKGNYRFRSSTNQAPTQFTAGTLGEEKRIYLEIKLVADVGLVGFPNAGKSTLLNALTHANARVSNYPFTTLSPNLGVLRLKDKQEIIIADIPGLIEGASQGKGLGDEFLRHVERTRLILHLIDPFDFSYTKSEDIVENSLSQYDILRKELMLHKSGLETKPELIVVTKMDITEVSEQFETIKTAFEKKGKEIFGISSATGAGLDLLVNNLLQMLSQLPRNATFAAQEPIKLFNINNLPNRRLVFKNNVKDWEGDKKI